MIGNVVIGANGMVGRALMEHLSDSIGTYRNGRANLVPDRRHEYLDITNTSAVYYFLETHKPQKIFIAAASTNVDGCEETNRDNVNINGMKSIVNNAYRLGSQVIFFSSSYVFDGKSQVPYKTDDETFPLNVYGRQKETIEKFIKSTENLKWLIIRTVGVFGRDEGDRNFVAQVVSAIKRGGKLVVPADQTMNPIWSMDLAKTAIKISDRYTNEVFHVAGSECMTKYEFAIRAAYRFGCDKPHDIIVGSKSEDMKQLAIRPKNGCLDCKGLRKYAIRIPSFKKGLAKYIEQCR